MWLDFYGPAKKFSHFSVEPLNETAGFTEETSLLFCYETTAAEATSYQCQGQKLSVI
jgi:hypothetical protein